jgi:hypothetical protein
MSVDKNEKELTEATKNDTFKCDYCKQISTREKIRKTWKAIPFGNEEEKTFYCGCMGWD